MPVDAKAGQGKDSLLWAYRDKASRRKQAAWRAQLMFAQKKIRDAFNLISIKCQSHYPLLATQYSSVMNIKNTYHKHKVGGSSSFGLLLKYSIA